MMGSLAKFIATLTLLAAVGSALPPAHAAAGRMQGAAAVTQTGAATYAIPIVAPPGTRGMTPTLSLVYSSHGGSGWIGEGWDIAGLSTISRCAKTWAQDGESRNVRLDYEDRYCLDGNRLRLVSGSHGSSGAEYRTENETFTRITSSGAAGNGPASFTAKMKDGLIYEYGNTADSRIESLGLSTARSWAVNKISDRAGNAILFTYAKDSTNGGYRLATVQYTQNLTAGLAAAYQIELIYETQPASEIDSRYLGGKLIKDITRLVRVDVTHNTVLVRRYHVTYEPGLSSAGKGRVQSIQECAGSAGSECFPATTFQYQNGSAGVGVEFTTAASVPVTPWPIDVNGDGRRDLVYSSSFTSGAGTWMVMLATGDTYGTPFSTGISNTNYSQAIVIDYNADGLDDLLVPYSGGTWWVMLGTTSGLAAPVNTGAPVTATGFGANAHAIDVDGDGLQDLVWADLVGFAGGDSIRYRLRELSGGFSSTVYTLVEPRPADSQIVNPVWGFPNLPGSRNPDFDGNGRDDLLYKRIDRVFIDGPNIWQHTHYTATVMPGNTGTLFPSHSSGQPLYGDFNGDGRTDVLYATSASTSRMRFGTGTGFTGEVPGPAPAPYTSWLSYDWNGDTFDDILARRTSGGTWDLIPSTGESFAATQSTGITTSDVLAIADINGDGLDDLAYNVSGGWRFRLRNGNHPDLLTTVTDGYGNTQTFEHVATARSNYNKGNDAVFPRRDDATPLQVVKKLISPDGIGGTFTLSYYYYRARVHLQGRGFEGFHARRIHDSRSGLYAYEHYRRDFPYTGLIERSELYQPDNATLIARTVNTWAAHADGSGYESRFFPYISQSTTTRYEVGGSFNGSLISTATTTNSVDATTGTLYDSTTTTTEATTANGIQPSASYVERIHLPLASLQTSLSQWCLGRPGQIEHTSSHSQYGGGAVTRTRSLSWDMDKCRPTQMVDEPGHAQLQITRTLGYDNFGNVSSDTVTGASMVARTTTVSWGTTGQFPISVTNALSQAEGMTWDYARGVPVSRTDANTLVTSWQYDAFGRRTREDRPDGTATTWTYADCATGATCANSHHKLTVTESSLDSSSTLVTDGRLYLDKLDRPISIRTRALAGAYTRIDTEYDAFGRLHRQSAPCWEAACTQYWTTLTYDTLGRTTQLSRPASDAGGAQAATTTMVYAGLTVTTTDALSKSSTKISNVLGTVARSADHDGYYQTFDYDAFGSILRVTDSLGYTLLSNTYNLRGMRTAQVDLAAGSWSYTPNALGEVVSQTDAKSQATTFVYDQLGRLTQRTETEGVTTFTHGTSAASRNIGQLASVSGPGYSESYGYDAIGRLQQRSISSDITYQYNYTYNTLGALSTLTYPTSTSGYRFKVEYEYQNGLLKKVKDGNAPYAAYWEATDTDARGNIINETLGNGIQTVRGYDAVTGLIDSIVSGNGAVQNLSYTWNAVGVLTQRRDVRQSLTEDFSYDNLHRLTSITGPAPMSIGYDPRGNAMSMSGDVLSSAAHSISWYSYNLPHVIQTTTGNHSSQFFYAPDRSCWKQVASYGGTTEQTIYAGGLIEKVTRGAQVSWRHYIVGGSGVVALYTRESGGSNTLHYMTKDHLGSIDTISTSAGAITSRLSFAGHGRRRNEATWTGNPTSGDWTQITATTRHGFTGHEMLDNLNLTHMNGRVYDQLVGSFISPDPFIDGAGHTQGWNRYMYVKGGALSFTDPSGFGICRTGKCLWRADPPRQRDHDGPRGIEGVTAWARRSDALEFGYHLDVRSLLAANANDLVNSLPGPSRSLEAGGTIEEVVVTGVRIRATRMVDVGAGSTKDDWSKIRCLAPGTMGSTFAGDSAARRATVENNTSAEDLANIALTLGGISASAAQSLRNANSVTPGTISSRGFDGVVRSRAADTAAQVRALNGASTALNYVARVTTFGAGTLSVYNLGSGYLSNNSNQMFNGAYGIATAVATVFNPGLGIGMALAGVAAPDANETSSVLDRVGACPKSSSD